MDTHFPPLSYCTSSDYGSTISFSRFLPKPRLTTSQHPYTNLAQRVDQVTFLSSHEYERLRCLAEKCPSYIGSTRMSVSGIGEDSLNSIPGAFSSFERVNAMGLGLVIQFQQPKWIPLSLSSLTLTNSIGADWIPL
jgi:hypothetical protein